MTDVSLMCSCYPRLLWHGDTWQQLPAAAPSGSDTNAANQQADTTEKCYHMKDEVRPFRTCAKRFMWYKLVRCSLTNSKVRGQRVLHDCILREFEWNSKHFLREFKFHLVFDMILSVLITLFSYSLIHFVLFSTHVYILLLILYHSYYLYCIIWIILYYII